MNEASESGIIPVENETERIWDLEVVENPQDRQRIIKDTWQERVAQSVASVLGFGELTVTNLATNQAKSRKMVALSLENALLAGVQIKAVDFIVRIDPKDPLPVDRKTYASTGKAIIVLDQIAYPGNPNFQK